jgi:hypothetical protein
MLDEAAALIQQHNLLVTYYHHPSHLPLDAAKRRAILRAPGKPKKKKKQKQKATLWDEADLVQNSRQSGDQKGAAAAVPDPPVDDPNAVDSFTPFNRIADHLCTAQKTVVVNLTHAKAAAALHQLTLSAKTCDAWLKQHKSSMYTKKKTQF